MLATFFAQLIPSTEVIEKADSVKTTFTQKLAQLSEMSGQDLLKTVASGLVNIVIKIDYTSMCIISYWPISSFKAAEHKSNQKVFGG